MHKDQSRRVSLCGRVRPLRHRGQVATAMCPQVPVPLVDFHFNNVDHTATGGNNSEWGNLHGRQPGLEDVLRRLRLRGQLRHARPQVQHGEFNLGGGKYDSKIILLLKRTFN
jgi:hypothetical protein